MVKRVLVEEEAVTRVARDMRVTRETVYKWVRRYQQEGLSGLWRAWILVSSAG